jgi:hypothetical protein
MTALATFLATAKRIEGLLGELPGVRRIPENRVAIAKSVRIDTPSWTIPKDQEDAHAAAQDLRGRLMAEYRAAGEAARDARLAEIAAEIRALVSVIPQQAAAASIELGHQARMLQHEAQGGTT